MEPALEDTRSPLVPSRSNTSNSMNGALQDQKKRKRSSLGETELSDWFDAKIISSTNAGSVVSFSPISTILRAHVPLAWLSGRQVCESLPAGSVFEAIIPSVSRWDYHILVARHVPNGILYGIEKVTNTTFVCHPLQSWVCQTWIQQAAIGATPPVDVQVLLESTNSRSHLRKSSSISISSSQQLPTAPCSPKQPKNRRGILARRSILDKEKRADTWETQEVLYQDSLTECEAVIVEPEVDEPASVHTKTGIDERSELPRNSVSAIPDCAKASTFDNHRHAAEHTEQQEPEMEQIETDHLSPDYLRKRYLETLYLSKTSLAFYAKGPLSRTRARMRMSGFSLSSNQLAQYYRESILPAKKLDLKYKESVKNTVTAIPQPEVVDLEHESLPASNISKSRKPKKTKPSKDALWPTENEYLEQWWKKRDYKKRTHSADAQVAELQEALSQLRMRETELQIILVLEVIALESQDHSPKANDVCHGDQVSEIQLIGLNEKGLPGNRAPLKKQRNLDKELENLLDRLCIWHSVGLEDDITSPQRGQASGSASITTVKDRLRDFCKDVIVPFYGGKLPEKCKLICKCLGGSEVTPQTTRTSVSRPMPGSAVTTRNPTGTRRTLEKVLSEDFSVHHPVPTLMRSSTVPLAPAVKREPSERPKSRSAMHKSISFINREIDLVADAKVTAAKRRKLDTVAAQKRELEAAIEALKKPNRSMVAKDFMDAIEQRTSEDRTTIKRVEPIQISATPRHGRFRAAEDDDFNLPPMPFTLSHRDEPVIPSSTTKPHGNGPLAGISYSSAKKKAVLSAISDTPSRRHVQSLPLEEVTNTNRRTTATKNGHTSLISIHSMPAIDRWSHGLHTSIAITPPGRKESQQSEFFNSGRSASVNSIEKAFRDVPEIPHAAGKAMDRVMGKGQDSELGMSIYESLGWDDDDDDI